MTRRYALIIGVAQYSEYPLPNAVADAGRATDALRRRGFNTILIEDADARGIDAAINSFSESVDDAEIALIYLAGHAVERYGVGYFLPSDFPFPLSSSKAKQCGIRLNDLINATQFAKSRLVVLDACRNWPTDPIEQLGLSIDIDELAAEEREWRNVLLAYSTSASATAGDGAEGMGSLFCRAFCRHILLHSLNIEDCFRSIAQEVTETSQLRQQPWTYSSLQQPISFSDLPRFMPLQRHVLPHTGSGVAGWCLLDQARRGIYAGTGNAQAWHVDLAGWKSVPFSGSATLVGAAVLQKHLILAGGEGEIFVAGGGSDPIARIPVDSSFGLIASPDRLGFMHYGNRTATVFRLTDTELKEVVQVDTDFDIYCGAYLTDELVWLGGERGQIAALNLTMHKPTLRFVTNLASHIYAMAISPNSNDIFCAGESSLLVQLDTGGNIRETLLEERRPRTAAAVRSALLEFANDDVIRNFIFDPSALAPGVQEDLERMISPISLPSCAHAPGLPILAVGTNESTVILFDTRDAQILQEIDISTGFPGDIAGLVFLSDHELVAVNSDGQALFLLA